MNGWADSAPCFDMTGPRVPLPLAEYCLLGVINLVLSLQPLYISDYEFLEGRGYALFLHPRSSMELGTSSCFLSD